MKKGGRIYGRGFETKREALEYERQKKLNNSRSMDMKLSEFMEVYFEDKQNELNKQKEVADLFNAEATGELENNLVDMATEMRFRKAGGWS